MIRQVSVIAALGVLALASPSWAGMQFLTYEGRDSVHEGQGGEKKIVGGVEFWMSGTPPHRFQVLGSIEDERHKSGIIGAIAMSSLEKDVANLARRSGGDAVILTDARDNIKGIVGSSFGSASGDVSVFGSGNSAFGSWSGSGSSTSFARPIESHSSHYVVVRYLGDLPAPAPSGGQPVPSQAPQQPASGQ